MTAGTVRLVGCKLPGNDLRIAHVTRAAVDRRAMVGIRSRQVSIGDWRPAGGPVTGIAWLSSDEVPGPFSLSRRAVVAIGARHGLARVIHPRNVECHRALVAGIAR